MTLAEKKEMRQRILAERMALPREAVIAKSKQIAERIFAMPEFIKANTIMLYHDFKKEPMAGEIISQALAQGKRVILPVSEMPTKRIIPKFISSYPEDLQVSNYGIREPKAHCQECTNLAEIDLIIIPGVGFDPNGGRLGYGAGFYDRFLAKVPEQTPRIAVCFEIQVIPSIHPERHDMFMHQIVTEDRIIIPSMPKE